jgi:hypothetical protein
MAEGHQHRPEDDGAGAADPAIGDDAAGDRRQIDEAAVEAGDGAAHRERRQRPVMAFQRASEPAEAPDALDMAGLEQLVLAVERQQRRHAVIGKALPGFREGQIAEPARMAEKGAVGLVFECGRSVGGVHSQKSTFS